ncbi:phosphotransferase [Clostridium sp. MSJ-11]|uniref:Phosphotransferase n=1 Tax=Clostridium mobile TaxID=2841512 RepID=A0ABS6EIS0_9CLOT|nr:phosphotransferase [Clostridium mobile]MBU5484586.1 phosphotransferase [Clostridium mobile]
MYKELHDITELYTWKTIEKINSGWSSDVKYYVEDYLGNKLLLRISDISYLNSKIKEFEIIKKFNTLDFQMSKAISIGVCNNKKNVYMLLNWVEGVSLGKAMEKLAEKEQYDLGIQAGKVLKQIHSIDVEDVDIPLKDKKERKLQKLERYENSSVRIDNDQLVIDYVKSNIDKIDLLPPVYKHGDFHVGNLIFTPDKHLGVIDFNRWECGDPYEEFYKVQSFDVEVSIPFSIGQIDGYFDHQPPRGFWEILAVYVAHASLFSIAWSEKFGDNEIKGMKRRAMMTFQDYDNFQSIIPHWYKDNFMRYRK